MKPLRLLLYFLLCLLIVIVLLSLLLPARQTVRRTITINAPVQAVYEQVSRLENFFRFAVWARHDSSTRYTYTGTDGTTGAAATWTGDPALSGKGEIRLVSLEAPLRVEQEIEFLEPRPGKASSRFTLRQEEGPCTVTWEFSLATPRPWNIFNLFGSMDKAMGPDFEEGLSLLKTRVEQTSGTPVATPYKTQEMDFPATRFAFVRQQIAWQDLPRFREVHYPLAYQAALQAGGAPGTESALVFNWDPVRQQTDWAAAVPVKPGTAVTDNLVKIIDLPAAKAVYVDHFGSPATLADAYAFLEKDLREKGLGRRDPFIQQYLVDGKKEKDTARWCTRVLMLLK
jgi:hypothetical protein